MNNSQIKELIYILMAIVLGFIIVKFLIWLLPVILIGACSYYIYKKIKKNKKQTTNKKTKKKPIKIIDMVEEDK